MPRQLTDRGIRLNNIAAYLTPALTLLDELNDALGPPFVHSIARTTLSLLTLLQVRVVEAKYPVNSQFLESEAEQG